jgi:prevent-host-death family protein
MKTATAKELRNRTSAILESVRKGNEVVITMRGKSVALLSPVKEKESVKQFSPAGFGVWKERKDLKDVRKWVDERRKTRFQR